MKKLNIFPPGFDTYSVPGLSEASYTGKVRVCFDLPRFPNFMLMVNTDRVSVHNVGLPCLIRGQGIALNLLDIFWIKQFPEFKHDLIAWGDEIEDYLPDECTPTPDLLLRGRIVRKLDMLSAELIYRGVLTGSAWNSYKNSGMVCGQKLPEGMKEWDAFPEPIFTPTEKSEDDAPMEVSEFITRFGVPPVESGMDFYVQGRKVLEEKGFHALDTKFELGFDRDNQLTFADERLTFHSSRFVTPEEFAKAKADPTYRPKSYDKQPLRDWVTQTFGITGSTKLTQQMIDWVHTTPVPQELIEQTERLYSDGLRQILGMSPEQFVLQHN